MATYIEYGVTLTDGQKSKLLSAIKKRSPITFRLKHSHLRGSDEIMLTQRQIAKIQKSLANGTGADLKISQAQIRSLVQHGGNLFTSLARIGAKLLPFAIKGVSKVAPALATGAASALGDLGIKKLFGKGGTFGAGITIPEKFFPMLKQIEKELTKAQINQINKIYNTGGRLVIKPTKAQIEGGFLGTLASIGIPMAVSLLPKLFGSGLQVDRGTSRNTRNVYVPRHGEGYYPPPFYGNWGAKPPKWGSPIGMGVKKKKAQRQGFATGKKQPIQLNSHIRRHFVIKPLSNFDLMEWVKTLGIKHLRGIYSRDRLPQKIKKECGIINLDDIQGPGTHWVCYRNLDSVVEYFDPFGLIMPSEALK